MATLLERAEVVLGEALLEEDTVERYSLNKHAELLIEMHKAEAMMIQAHALVSVGVSLKRVGQYVAVR